MRVIHMATPTKPGQRVMLTMGYGEVKEGRIGRVIRRRTEEINQHTWNVRLETGESVEVREDHLYVFTD